MLVSGDGVSWVGEMAEKVEGFWRGKLFEVGTQGGPRRALGGHTDAVIGHQRMLPYVTSCKFPSTL